MGGPSAHGQRNKAHKAGRRAGLSARDKHKVSKQGGASALGAQRRALKRSGAAAGAAGSGGGGGGGKKLQRALAAKQQRDAKRAEQTARRRAGTGAPMVVAVLPMCAQADARAFWEGALAACAGGGGDAGGAASATADAKRRAAAAAVGMEVELAGEPAAAAAVTFGGAVTCAVVAGGRGSGGSSNPASSVRLTWLSPPRDRADPLAIVELARAADAVVLLTTASAPSGPAAGRGKGGGEDGEAANSAVDAEGAAALAVLRAMGLPHVVAAVQQQRQHAKAGLRSRAASHAGGDLAMMEDDEDAGGAAAAAGAAAASASAGASMKARSAARKAAERALERHLPAASGGGQLRLLPADTPADFAAIVRHLADRHPPSPPAWRQARAQLLPERVEFCADADADAVAATGTLFLTGYVRGGALCVDQPVCVPGAGDFRVVRVEAAVPAAAAAAAGQQLPAASPFAPAAVVAPAPSAAALFPVLAELPLDPREAEPVARLNAPPDDQDGAAGGADGEQTWPTEGELAAAEARRRRAAAKAGAATRRRKLPTGTSEYQAAWLLDEDEDEDGDDEDEDEEDEEGDEEMMMMMEGGAGQQRRPGPSGADGRNGAAAAAADGEEPPLLLEDDDGDYGMLGGGPGGGGADYTDDEDPAERAALLAQLRGASAGRATAAGGVPATAAGNAAAADVSAAAADDGQWPDEIELAPGVAARVRLAKYRALKSLRAGAWDPAEGTPVPYARVFAFENAQRAAKRARQAAAEALARAQQQQQQQQQQAQKQQQQGQGEAMAADEEDRPPAVAPGTYVRVALARVPEAAAARFAQRVQAALCGGGIGGGGISGSGGCGGGAPPVAFGLLEHESKLSVLNLALRRSPLPATPTPAQARAAQPLASKAPLLLVLGGRAFVSRPVFSDDHHGAELHRMARFLRAGESCVATLYGPISHGPLPVLAFRLPEGHPLLVQEEQAGGAEAAAAAAAATAATAPPASLVATGALRSVDPDRVVLKRAVLTGYPVRTHKSKAVVRFMFGTPDDVRWFAPAELWTRSGRRGRITEPLGTHGAFKARFDGPVIQRDAVCISLYKRVFPKWPGAVAASGAGGGGGGGGAGASAASLAGGPGAGEGFESAEAVVGRDGARFALLV